jgi:hypothetical protein
MAVTGLFIRLASLCPELYEMQQCVDRFFHRFNWYPLESTVKIHPAGKKIRRQQSLVT